MWRSLIILVLAGSATATASNRARNSDARLYSDLSKIRVGQSVNVYCSNGSVVFGRWVALMPAQLLYLRTDSPYSMSNGQPVQLSQVDSVSYQKRGLASSVVTIGGAVAGIIVGARIGAGLAAKGSGGCGFGCGSWCAGGMIGGIMGGVAGTVVGLHIGNYLTVSVTIRCR